MNWYFSKLANTYKLDQYNWVYITLTPYKIGQHQTALKGPVGSNLQEYFVRVVDILYVVFPDSVTQFEWWGVKKYKTLSYQRITNNSKPMSYKL